MSGVVERPHVLRTNAWDGTAALSQDFLADARWGLEEKAFRVARWMAPPEIDERDWRHEEVGWGLVAPDDDALDVPAKARGEDLPEPLRALLKDRPGSPVLRYRPELRVGYLRRYYLDGLVQDLSVASPIRGTATGRVPRYLLIYAGPDVIPWAMQYALNMSCYVGRLDLDGEALANYISALMGSFDSPDPRAPLVWAVDHGAPDITWLMARAVGRKLHESFGRDPDLTGRCWLGERDATITRLAEAIDARKPGLIITTSHGMTGPLDDADRLRGQLGGLVDVANATLTHDILGEGSAAGAIWYAHACCSAGSDVRTRYDGLLPADGNVASMLSGVASAAGAMISPLPRRLLGQAKPIRAFLGHVEPTFDWTLRDPQTGQVTTQELVACLWTDLYRSGIRMPVGMALARLYREAGSFLGGWRAAMDDVNNAVPHAQDWALYCQLAAMDRQTLVILGDPTVALPTFAAARRCP